MSGLKYLNRALMAGGIALLTACMNPADSTGNGSEGSAAPSAEGGADAAFVLLKTEICHIPYSSPENAYTLSIPNLFVAFHLAHGDELGRCDIPKTEVPDDTTATESPSDSAQTSAPGESEQP